MAKVLVLYYSAYGHIEAMANAVAAGARGVGAHVDVKRVPELVPEDLARRAHFKLDQDAPIAEIDDLTGYDGSRRPTNNELQGARYQGRKIAEVAIALHG